MAIITKTAIQSYKIRGAKHGAWADITVDEGVKSGRLSISSDYGDWQYYWGACGCSFKEFLTGVGKCYVAGKFRADNHLDMKSTAKRWREQILEYRYDESLNRQEARELWQQVKRMEDECGRMDDLLEAFHENQELLKFLDYDPSPNTTYDPSFDQFWEVLWTVFVDEIQKELATAAK